MIALIYPLVAGIFDLIKIADQVCSILSAEFCIHNPGAYKAKGYFLYFFLLAIVRFRGQTIGLE